MDRPRRAASCPVAGGPPPGGGGMAAGGVIEAGCSYNGTQLPGDIGATFQISPARPAARHRRPLGHRRVHGRLRHLPREHPRRPDLAGRRRRVRAPGTRSPAYRGSTRNGVQSSDSRPVSEELRPAAQWRRPGGCAPAGSRRPRGIRRRGYPPPARFIAARVSAARRASAAAARAGRLRAPPATGHRGRLQLQRHHTSRRVGTTRPHQLPARLRQRGGSGEPTSTPPTPASAVAAIHAGIITDGGGNVFVTLNPAAPPTAAASATASARTTTASTRRATTCQRP